MVTPLIHRVAVGLAASSLVFFVSAGSGDAAPTAPRATGGCTSEEVVLMVDQSASLKQQDPGIARLLAGETLIDTLANASLPAHLALFGFGSAVRDQSEWELPADSAAAKNALKAITSKHGDQNTDYVLAIREASRYFETRPGTDAACRTMVWFTDGAYDISEMTEGVGTYTLATSKPAVENQFEAQTCGPLLMDSLLGKPLTEQVKAANYAIDFIDLKSQPSAKRERTDRVLNRMFGPDSDPCRVAGSRVTAENTQELVSKFFTQGQANVGRQPVADCGVLANGVPISAVKSLAVLGAGQAPVVHFVGPSGELAIGTPAAFYSLSPEERRSPGLLKVVVDNGLPASCFMETELSTSLATQPELYSSAESATIGIRVTGTGLDGKPEGALDESFVHPLILVDGKEQTPQWDADTRQFTVEVAGPFEQSSIKVTSSAQFLLTTETSPETTSTISITSVPPSPNVSWSGGYLIEGAGSIAGKLIIKSGAKAPGTLCVKFRGPQPILNDDGKEVGSFIVSTDEVCGNLGETLAVPAEAAFPKSANTFASTKVPYVASFQGPGQEPEKLGTGPLELAIDGFQIVKKADTGAGIKFALLVAALVGLLSYLLLFATARWQGRLPDPSRLQVASSELTISDGAGGRKTLTGQGDFAVADMVRPKGDRSGIDFGPFRMRRTWPWNPLADLQAVVSVDEGRMLCEPASGSPAKSGRSQRIATNFPAMSAIHVKDGVATVHLLMRSGSTNTDYKRQRDAALAKANRAGAFLFESEPEKRIKAAKPAKAGRPSRPTSESPTSPPVAPSRPQSGPKLPPKPTAPIAPVAPTRTSAPPKPPTRPSSPPSSGFKPPKPPRLGQ